jgi:hypothetical protein
LERQERFPYTAENGWCSQWAPDTGMGRVLRRVSSQVISPKLPISYVSLHRGPRAFSAHWTRTPASLCWSLQQGGACGPRWAGSVVTHPMLTSLSLGMGQRFAAKGGYILAPRSDGCGSVSALTDLVIPWAGICGRDSARRVAATAHSNTSFETSVTDNGNSVKKPGLNTGNTTKKLITHTAASASNMHG